MRYAALIDKFSSVICFYKKLKLYYRYQ